MCNSKTITICLCLFYHRRLNKTGTQIIIGALSLMFHSCHRLKHFSVHQHPSAALPRHPWLCVALEKQKRITHAGFQHSNEEWRSGRAVRRVLPAPFSNESSASDARLGGPLGLTPGFLSSFGSCRGRGGATASHLCRPTRTSPHQSKYHTLSTGIFTPSSWSCRPRGGPRQNMQQLQIPYQKTRKMYID